MDLKEMGWETELDSHGSPQGPVAGSSECGKDLQVPENAENFFRS